MTYIHPAVQDYAQQAWDKHAEDYKAAIRNIVRREDDNAYQAELFAASRRRRLQNGN